MTIEGSEQSEKLINKEIVQNATRVTLLAQLYGMVLLNLVAEGKVSEDEICYIITRLGSEASGRRSYEADTRRMSRRLGMSEVDRIQTNRWALANAARILFDPEEVEK
ncbi:hypothetical protein M1563_04370 [Patescibacteria group bacterium]|nr:hypothetical protein [Patescibacteria group bacterium]MCL5409347.1 hypothetical protein [Patescibacteria group bacterium]